MLAGLHFVNAGLGAIIALIILRADARSWDNKLIALVGFSDALVQASAGISFLYTDTLVGGDLTVQLAGRVLITYPLLQFALSFPFNRTPRLRGLLFGLALSALSLFVVFRLQKRALPRDWQACAVFLPYYALMLCAQARNLGRLGKGRQPRGVLLIMLALALRYGLELASGFLPSTWLGVSSPLRSALGVLVSHGLIAHAVLVHHSLRVRGAVADGGVHGALGLLGIGLVALAIHATLKLELSPGLLRCSLAGVSAIPLGSLLVWRKFAPRIESAILSPIDPQRTVRRAVFADSMRATTALTDPNALVAVTQRAVQQILVSGSVRFLHARPFPEPEAGTAVPTILASYLQVYGVAELWSRDADRLPSAVASELRQLNAELVIVARTGERVFGLFAISGGTLDRDAMLMLGAMAAQLGFRLENCLLFKRTLTLQSELDEARYLATLGAFAAAIAHDIRSPLTSIQLNCQLLRDELQLSPGGRQSVGIALRELTRMNDNVSEILQYARPVELKTSICSLSRLSKEVARDLTPRFAARQIRLHCEPLEPVAPVSVDSEQIRRVLVNLLDNAANASQPGDTVTLITRMDLSGRVALEVSDRGFGIAPNNVAKIFEPFFTTRSDGTGLGLAIVHKIVRAHGGEVRVQSAPGAGTTFSVLLPA